MYDQPRPDQARPALTFEQLLERVRYEGAIRERAEEAVRTVLAALGRQLVGDERVDPTNGLPVEAALVFTAQAVSSGAGDGVSAARRTSGGRDGAGVAGGA